MRIEVRVNAKLGLVLDDTAFTEWLAKHEMERGEAPTLKFLPVLKDRKHKITQQDLDDVNAKIDELWAKYPRFAKYEKPYTEKTQDLLGEDHALILT